MNPPMEAWIKITSLFKIPSTNDCSIDSPVIKNRLITKYSLIPIPFSEIGSRVIVVINGINTIK